MWYGVFVNAWMYTSIFSYESEWMSVLKKGGRYNESVTLMLEGIGKTWTAYLEKLQKKGTTFINVPKSGSGFKNMKVVPKPNIVLKNISLLTKCLSEPSQSL